VKFWLAKHQNVLEQSRCEENKKAIEGGAIKKYPMGITTIYRLHHSLFLVDFLKLVILDLLCKLTRVNRIIHQGKLCSLWVFGSFLWALGSLHYPSLVFIGTFEFS